MDYNIQVDAPSAYVVLDHCSPTIVPMTMTVETALRRAHLPRLEQAGPLGKLLARQAKEYARDERIAEKFAATCPALPGDILNFQHDPLACAIAMGWRDEVEITELPLRIELRDGYLHETIDPAGKPMQVVTRIEGDRFNQFWLDMVTNRVAL
jgi:inosine-uridine nucleoside N-ribohydrolase